MAEGLYDYTQGPQTQTFTVEMLRDAIEQCIQEQFEPTIHIYPPGVLPEPEKHPVQTACDG